MKEREEKHWTDETELIERYVLNRLNADERNELEDHLRVCEVCKRAVRAEQVLVAGIRRSGREQFKAELKTKVADIPERKTQWVQILSAAAVIVILLTIGIYNRWFESQTVEQQSNVTLAPPSTEKDSFAKADDRMIAERPSSSLEEEHKSEPRDESLAPTKQKRSEPTREVATQEEISDKISAREGFATKGEEAKVAGAGRSDYSSAPMAAAKQATSVARNDAMGGEWIEGEILPTADGRSNGAATPNTYLFKRGGRTEGEARRSMDRESQTSNVGMIALSQQNSVALPPALQSRQQLYNSSKVLTRLERVGDKTQLTLYLDSLVDERELSNAIVETPRPDSLILNFSNQRIGYRLPPSLNQQLQAKPTK